MAAVPAHVWLLPARSPPYYRSMRHAFAKILAEEGPMSFFSGLSASILGLSHIMIQFPLYERLKDDLARRRDAPAETSGVPARAQPEVVDIIAASAASKLVASTITYPHEVIRTRLQFDQGGKLYTGLVDATLKTLRHDGLQGFWLGFHLNIVRTIPQCVVTFTLYEFLSRRLQLMLGLSADADSTQGGAKQDDGSGTGAKASRLGTIARTRSENRA